MEVVLFTCSHSVALDARTNNVSLFHIIEQISFPTFPVVCPPLVALTMMVRKPDESETPKLTMKWTLNDSSIFEFPMEVNFQGLMRSRNFADIGGMVLQGPGILRAEVCLDDSWEAEWRIEVKKIGGPQTTDMSTEQPAEK
jgi:hypothetical protein